MHRSDPRMTTKTDTLFGLWAFVVLVVIGFIIFLAPFYIGHVMTYHPSDAFQQACLDRGGDPVYVNSGEQLVCTMNGQIISYF